MVESSGRGGSDVSAARSGGLAAPVSVLCCSCSPTPWPPPPSAPLLYPLRFSRDRAQVVGWPPVRSYRKNTLAASATKTKGEDEGRSEAGCCYVKVRMDGAPYLRKVDLKTYSSYEDLSLALEKMFSCFITGKSSSCKTSRRDRLTDGSRADALQDQEYVLTYEDKDADWMLVGDLPWDLFTTICQKLRIMRGSDAAGMAPRALEEIGQNK